MAACTEGRGARSAGADLAGPKARPHPGGAGRRAAGPQLGMACAAATLLLTACAGSVLQPRPSPLPMEQIVDDRACPRTQAPVLLVLLPGVHMTPAEMQHEGFIAAVRQRKLAVDIVIAGIQLDHTRDGSVIRRLRNEVVAPARAQGYRQIWLAGISLGAYLALQYERSHPGEVQGLLLIAPYLGRRTLTQQIETAGGPAAWRERVPPAAADDVDQALWAWLSALPAAAPPIWLAAGSEDRFAAEHRLLAGVLPLQRSSTLPGGHDWTPWRRLWAQWLDRGVLPAVCP